MDPHNDPLAASVKELAAAIRELAASQQSAPPVIQAALELLLRQSRRIARRLSALDAQTPAASQTTNQ